MATDAHTQTHRLTDTHRYTDTRTYTAQFGSKDFSALSRKVLDKSGIFADAIGSSGLTGQATINYIEQALIIEKRIRKSAIQTAIYQNCLALLMLEFSMLNSIGIWISEPSANTPFQGPRRAPFQTKTLLKAQRAQHFESTFGLNVSGCRHPEVMLLMKGSFLRGGLL